MQLNLAIMASTASAVLLFASLPLQAYAITMRPVMQDSDVLKIVEAARASMTEHHTSGCIAVADADGEILFLQRQESAAPNCVSIALAKVKTAARFQTATETYHQYLVQSQATMLAIPELTPLPGGMPLFSGEVVVGAVSISTPDGDLDLKVVAAAAAALK